MRRANASKLRHQFGKPTYIKSPDHVDCCKEGRILRVYVTRLRVIPNPVSGTATSVRDGKPTAESQSGLRDVLINTCCQHVRPLCSSKDEHSNLQFSSSTSPRLKLRNPAADDVLCIVSSVPQPPDQNISGTSINSRDAIARARDPDRSGIQIFGPEVSSS
jgi:hypothetical protein